MRVGGDFLTWFFSPKLASLCGVLTHRQAVLHWW